MIIKSIREAIGTRPLAAVSSTATLEHVSDVMQAQRVRAVVVVDAGSLCGIVTEEDVIRHASQHGGFDTAPVVEVMTRDVACVETRDSLLSALSQMTHLGYDQMPVIDLGQHVVGLITLRDIPVEYRDLQKRKAA